MRKCASHAGNLTGRDFKMGRHGAWHEPLSKDNKKGEGKKDDKKGGGKKADKKGGKETIEVGKASIGAVIGKGGATIKAISSETGARLDIAREGNDKGAIQISGTPEQIRAAKKMIQAALKPADITAVAVGADKLSFVIGSCSCPPASPTAQA